MKFTCPRNALASALALCAAVAEKSGPAFATSCVLFDTRDGTLKLSASDSTSAIRSVVPFANVAAGDQGRGYFGANARDALDRVKAMPDGEISCEEKAGAIVFKCGKRKHQTKALAGAEFPAFPASLDTKPLAIAGTSVAWIIARTVHAADLDATRPHTHGICLSSPDVAVGGAAGRVLRVDATDGRQMAAASVPAPGAEVPRDTVLALRSVHTLTRLVDGIAADVQIRLAAGRLTLTVGTTEYSTLLVAATPPPFAQIWDTLKETTVAVVAREALLDSARSVALGSAKIENNKFRGLKLSFAPGEDGAGSAGSLDLAGQEAEDSLVCSVEGVGCTLGMSAELIIGALSVVEGVDVRLGIGGELDPVSLRSVDAPGESRMVVMPARV